MCDRECLCKTCVHSVVENGNCGCCDDLDWTICRSGGFIKCEKYKSCDKGDVRIYDENIL